MSRAALSTADSTPLKFNSEDDKFRSSQPGVNRTDSGPVSENFRFSSIKKKKNQLLTHFLCLLYLLNDLFKAECGVVAWQ